eukprot:12914407-Alexandrium_andersonii.AAC.1
MPPASGTEAWRPWASPLPSCGEGRLAHWWCRDRGPIGLGLGPSWLALSRGSGKHAVVPTCKRSACMIA